MSLIQKQRSVSLSLSVFLVAALQSVFPQTELGTFMSLVKRDKERQLIELTQIVTGIRLFNKECGKGGEGIDDCKYGTGCLDPVILVCHSASYFRVLSHLTGLR